MRIVSAELDTYVSGTTHGDRLVAHAWRGGRMVAADLLVTDYSLSWNAGQPVQGQGTVTVADPDGTLAPIGMEDPLAPGGSRLQLTYVTGSDQVPDVPLGWWRIRKSSGHTVWRTVTGATSAPVELGLGDGPLGEVPLGGTLESSIPIEAETRVVSAGGVVVMDVDEETSTIVMERMDAEVVQSSSILGEVARLARDRGVSVSVLPGVIDRPVPSGLVYDEDAHAAIVDHLDRCDAVYRMGPEPSLEVVPAVGVPVEWALTIGKGGTTIEYDVQLSDDGLYNAAISKSETPEGQQLLGRAYLMGGPLAYGGPFGRVPIYHQSPAKTDSGVQADADTLLANRVASGEVEIGATCVAHYGLQLHDVIPITLPTVDGPVDFTGRVTSVALGSVEGAPGKSMRLGLAVSSDVLETIRWRARGA